MHVRCARCSNHRCTFPRPGTTILPAASLVENTRTPKGKKAVRHVHSSTAGGPSIVFRRGLREKLAISRTNQNPDNPRPDVEKDLKHDGLLDAPTRPQCPPPPIQLCVTLRWTWRLVLHPWGHDARGCYSAFLELSNAESLPPGFSRYVKLEFAMHAWDTAFHVSRCCFFRSVAAVAVAGFGIATLTEALVCAEKTKANPERGRTPSLSLQLLVVKQNERTVTVRGSKKRRPRSPWFPCSKRLVTPHIFPTCRQ